MGKKKEKENKKTKTILFTYLNVATVWIYSIYTGEQHQGNKSRAQTDATCYTGVTAAESVPG